jgi:hypothetical protein
MKPIDIIRKKLEPDFLKHHNSMMCVIPTNQDITDASAVGIIAMVGPLEKYDNYRSKAESKRFWQGMNWAGVVGVGGSATSKSPTKIEGKTMPFPVVIVNRPTGWFENDIAGKYYVLVLNPVQDRVALSVGFLVPKSILSNDKAWINSRVNPDEALKTANGDAIVAKSYEYNQAGEKVS